MLSVLPLDLIDGGSTCSSSSTTFTITFPALPAGVAGSLGYVLLGLRCLACTSTYPAVLYVGGSNTPNLTAYGSSTSYLNLPVKLSPSGPTSVSIRMRGTNSNYYGLLQMTAYCASGTAMDINVCQPVAGGVYPAACVYYAQQLAVPRFAVGGCRCDVPLTYDGFAVCWDGSWPTSTSVVQWAQQCGSACPANPTLPTPSPSPTVSPAAVAVAATASPAGAIAGASVTTFFVGAAVAAAALYVLHKRGTLASLGLHASTAQSTAAATSAYALLDTRAAAPADYSTTATPTPQNMQL